MALILKPLLPPPRSRKKNNASKLNSYPFHVSPRMSLQPQQNPNPSTSTDPLNSIARLLWGKSLPPHLLISTARTAWTATWKLMMRQMAPSDSSGSYSRPPSKFSAPTVDSRQIHNGRYHLYVALACPWAHRTLIVRALKGLEQAIPVSIASPDSNGSWEFVPSIRNRDDDGCSLIPSPDNANGCKNLKEVYGLRSGGFDGRSTVPMLWDTLRRDVVCNESSDIIELFNSGFDGVVGNPGLDLSPPGLKGKIKEWNDMIYPNVNNGVYRCGFAQSQEAYDIAVKGLFDTLDMLDVHLSTSRYLCGDMLTLADICLFTTLIRFDLVYNVLFKCTKKKLLEYPSLHGYMCDIYQIPKVAATCNFDAIMDGYYRILFPLNPGSIRPVMPFGCEHKFLCRSHNRETVSMVDKGIKVPVS